jgi:hypothetical protein
MTNSEELQRKIEAQVLEALAPFIPSGVQPHVRLLSSPDFANQPDLENREVSLSAGDSIVISLDRKDAPEGEEPLLLRRPELPIREFKPITIRGEPLSATVIRDRR